MKPYTTPVVSITSTTVPGQYVTYAQFVVSQCAFEFMGRPKEVSVMCDQFGVYIIQAGIDSRQRLKVSITNKGRRNIFQIKVKLSDQLAKFVGKNLLTREGDKYYLENIA